MRFLKLWAQTRILAFRAKAMPIRPLCSDHTPNQIDKLLDWVLDPPNEAGETQAHAQFHREMVDHYLKQATGREHLFVVQPLFYHDPTLHASLNSQGQCKLDETLALVRTLEWQVYGHTLAEQTSALGDNLLSFDNIQRVKTALAKLPAVSAVLVSTYNLSQSQRHVLEEEFGLPVLDRYHLILQIFHRHARTREAKLQVTLSEIPYLKRRLYQDMALENDNKHSKQRMGKLYFEKRVTAMKKREKQIHMALSKVKDQRAVLRRERTKQGRFPSVAVVGYTNSGKTSLIQALTGDNLEPKDKLFATLDVTVHQGQLPNLAPVLFVDTVGFISDIPTQLIASFASTLEDATLADLIIHVRDISHPDTVEQNSNVLKTLQSLDLPESLFRSMIVVGNKVDKVPSDQWLTLNNGGALIPISATQGLGLDFLLGRVQQGIMLATGRRYVRVRCRQGSEEYLWLHKFVTVSETQVDSNDFNYVILKVVMSQREMEQFKSRHRLAHQS
ncbi:hypothetical protein TCAL_02136 [Tigriopus californicus]|uniref:Hflx-type G domain-containing protein n=2 Tax=Tigriopus californicus TaxID=6832 RepID=A0A553N675_TIGCA|nr:hypothetical protein TCAL_02136 [Tigriopus californicus]|eukprot:TCALIF_02136-PA protein Name:"Similar to gtpbp6 Putative GTP-binding protein 6 (Xenopus laevis)" AED:0.05 eAED:0.05 QI:0/-1/0/1/-1/1/1/0/501